MKPTAHPKHPLSVFLSSLFDPLHIFIPRHTSKQPAGWWNLLDSPHKSGSCLTPPLFFELFFFPVWVLYYILQSIHWNRLCVYVQNSPFIFFRKGIVDLTLFFAWLWRPENTETKHTTRMTMTMSHRCAHVHPNLGRQGRNASVFMIVATKLVCFVQTSPR